ncbi:MAG: SprT-like domain-containing protein [Anaeroplasmataceae bacterium]|nr:SprT-like domain-containing protein [Anaeroplasmataceae bacterium]
MEYFIKKVNNLEMHYTKNDENLLKQVESCIQEIEIFLQNEYYFKSFDLKVLICPSVEEYIIQTRKLKEEYESWMIGCSLQEEHKIVLLSPTVIQDATIEDLLKIVKHEMVHFIFDTNIVNAKPAEWISEGIAILLADQTDLRYVSLTEYPKIDQISSEDDFADNGGYDYAGIYVWHFIDKFGKDAFLKVYRDSSVIKEYLNSGFEYEAISNYLEQKKK